MHAPPAEALVLRFAIGWYEHSKTSSLWNSCGPLEHTYDGCMNMDAFLATRLEVWRRIQRSMTPNIKGQFTLLIPCNNKLFLLFSLTCVNRERWYFVSFAFPHRTRTILKNNLMGWQSAGIPVTPAVYWNVFLTEAHIKHSKTSGPWNGCGTLQHCLSLHFEAHERYMNMDAGPQYSRAWT